MFFIGGPYLYDTFELDLSLLTSKYSSINQNHLPSLLSSTIPGSPMARRTKHEIKSAQKYARYRN